MHMVGTGCFAIALSLMAFATSAEARPNTSTKYTYYPVSGSSAVEVYQTLVAKGPSVKGVKAYATTTAVSSQSGKLIQGSTCAIQDYKVNMSFTIRLPKLANAGALSGGTKREWDRFSAFLKKHEETHRSIWLDCGSQMERKVSALRVATCSELDRKTVQLWKQTNAACNKRHERLDAAAQGELLQQSFVRLVLHSAARSQNAMAIPKHKKRKKG